MKKAILGITILLLSLLSFPVFSQNDPEPEALGLPGDNLNLYAVLDVFQKSKTLEDFERAINDKTNTINNLDLNNDRNIDYIKVISQKNGDSHFIILQVPINEKENQDVAVIEVGKDQSGAMAVQIIGDEDLYGKNYIVEPSYESAGGTPNPGYTGDKTVIVNNTTNNYNNGGYDSVGSWPVVIYLFSPVYYVYQSPFYWGYYPSYWHPWAPVYYYDYWGYHHHYYTNRYYHRTGIVRNPTYYYNYADRRTRSTVVVTNRRAGTYKATYNGRTFKKPAEITRAVSPTRVATPNTRTITPTRNPSSPATPRTSPGTPRTPNPSAPRATTSPAAPRATMPPRAANPRRPASQNAPGGRR